MTDLEKLTHLINTVHRLRAPGGCPWDGAQTHQSLRQYLIEEAHETLDVLDQVHTPADLKNDAIRNSLREELGDVLLQILLHSEMANETGAFNFYDVAQALDEKMIRRHPHVFGDAAKIADADGVLVNWEKQKQKEKAAKSATASVLDGLPKGLPALQRAGRVIERVTKVGFQWPDVKGPLEKTEEELNEVKVELEKLAREPSDATRKRVESEIGDLLFCVCNLAAFAKINPEDALREQLARFEGRFRHVEGRLRENGRTPEQSTLAEMDGYWNEAKTREKKV